MSEFRPVLTLEDVDSLDSDEVVAGYRSAAPGDPEPGNNHSRSFWRGWQCGMADKCRRPMNDEAGHRALVHAMVRRSGGLFGWGRA